ncbi:MAG: response regulator [Nitrosopumilales archaeon]|nr:MAG: response regulator [Nitrosopumilales archaeon]
MLSEDSDDIEAKDQDLIWHHHYLACKNYDRTIMNKLNYFRNLDSLNQTIRQNQLEQIDNTSIKNKRVMLVEDEDDIVMLFEMILGSDAELKIDSFTEPFAALNNFISGLYDLIMIDVSMPKMNGFELYHKIRKLDDKVKVCFLTAGEMYDEEIREETFPELDTNCFIRKPIANQDLIQRVKDILNSENNSAI